MSYRYIVQRIYCIRKVAKNIRNVDYDELVFENHATLLSALGKYRNFEKYKGRYYYHAHNE
ncbi:glycosyltransferase family 4 protein, partial [Lactobacillus delbrueckii subsp. bulgaricus]